MSNKKDLNASLKKWLGASYGGPSISYEDGKFILYAWGDAPVSMEIIAKSDTIEGLVDAIDKMKFGKK